MPEFFKFLRKEEKLVEGEVGEIGERIGPGIITGGADNDPAGIITYTTAGARTGFSLIWLMVLITPFMVVVQEMAGRIALVKQKGLNSIIKEHYGQSIAGIVMAVLVIANIATIGADLAGVAAVLGLITGINWLWFILPVALGVSYLVLFKQYKTVRKVLIILTMLLVVYIFSAILANPNWIEVGAGLVPAFSSMGFLVIAVGLIGTTISPYMLFWQASDELEEHKSIMRPKDLELDTAAGMIWSNIIAIFIIIAAGSTLFAAGIGVETAEQAALALQPFAGDFAVLLFSLGVIFSGFLALPVLAGSTAFAVAETFGWKEGMDNAMAHARGFWVVFALALLIGGALAFLPINPIEFLFYTQVLDGFMLPFLVILLLVLCNDKKVMGKNVNSLLKNIIGIILVLVLIALDLLLFDEIFGLLGGIL